MTVLMNNLKIIFGKKRNILFMLVLPIATIFYIVAVTTQEASYNIAILDYDNTKFTDTFEKVMEKDCKIVPVNNRDEVKNMILDRKIDIAIIFEEGFTKDIIDGKNVKVENVTLDGTNQNEPLQVNISSFLTSAKSIAQAAGKEEIVFYDSLEKFIEKKYAVEYKHFATSYLEDAENAVSGLGYLASCMLFFIMLTTGLMLEERMSGVTNRVVTTPIRVSSYYIQHFLSYYIIAVIQAVVAITILPYVSSVKFGNNALEVFRVIIVACSFALICIAIGVFVNSVSKNTFMAGAFSTLFELPLLMLGGCLWPREIMPDVLKKIGKLLPTTWYMEAEEILVNGGTFIDVIGRVLLMAGVAALLLLLTFVIKRKRIAD